MSEKWNPSCKNTSKRSALSADLWGVFLINGGYEKEYDEMLGMGSTPRKPFVFLV